jgi:hypothetical protein
MTRDFSPLCANTEVVWLQVQRSEAIEVPSHLHITFHGGLPRMCVMVCMSGVLRLSTHHTYNKSHKYQANIENPSYHFHSCGALEWLFIFLRYLDRCIACADNAHNHAIILTAG